MATGPLPMSPTNPDWRTLDGGWVSRLAITTTMGLTTFMLLAMVETTFLRTTAMGSLPMLLKPREYPMGVGQPARHSWTTTTTVIWTSSSLITSSMISTIFLSLAK